MFLKNVSYMFVANLLAQLLVLATLPVALRKLGVQGWESVVIAQIVINNVVWFVGQGFHFSGTVSVSQSSSRKKKSRILNAVILIQMLLLMVSLLVLLFLQALTEKFISFHIIVNGCILALAYILSLNWLLVGVNMFKYLAFLKVSPKVLLFIFIWLEPFELSSITYLYYWSVSELLVAIIVFLALSKASYLKLERVNFKFISILFSRSFKYFVMQSIPNIKDSILKILIGNFLPDGALGLYSVAEKLKGAGITIFQPILHVSFPTAANLLKGFKGDYLRFLTRIIVVQMLVGTLSSIFFYFFSNQIVELFAGIEFIRAADLLKVWAASILVVPFIDLTLNNVLIAGNRQVAYFTALFGYAMLTTSLVAIAVWWQSLQAVVTGVVVGDITFLIVLSWYILRNKPLRLRFK